MTQEAFLTRLQASGYGVVACAAPGDLTMGGALAIGAHGTAIPTAAHPARPGGNYSTLSDATQAVTAVVWDEAAQQYVARRFTRADRS